ncbi:hypothetical protein [Pseudorhodoferax sp.]|uniref:hypothetical protein n=1 Tax=Pseudorhodoferax sp. TaxID=1993553 RepID=UPI0039E6171C
MFHPGAAAGLAIALSLAACGGGDDPPADASPHVALAIVEAAPVTHAGDLRLAPGAGATIALREPDGLSGEPYCFVRFPSTLHTDGGTYEFTLAFRVRDRRVLAVTLLHLDTRWWVAAFQPDAAQASVDAARGTLHLARLRSTQGIQVGFEAVLDGWVRFPSDPKEPACAA